MGPQNHLAFIDGMITVSENITNHLEIDYRLQSHYYEFSE